MIKKLITAPTIWPINYDNIKEHLRISTTNGDHDIRLYGIIKSSTDQAEHITSRAIMTQTWAVVFESWDEMTFTTIPKGQLQSVTSIKYNDEDGAEQTVSSDDYLVGGIGTDEGMIIIPSDSDFTFPTLYDKDPIILTFVCGYTAATVPETIKTAVKLLVEETFYGIDASYAVAANLTPHKLYIL